MLLEAAGVTKRFGGVVAVNAVDLAISQRQAVGLIGPNGAGKTTLINLISGQLRADAGAIRLAGADVTGAPPHALTARGIARTFQGVRLFKGLSTIENVLVGRHVRMRADALRRLWPLGIPDRADRYRAVEAVHGISFGVEPGQVTALIGANGAGKSSTLAAISGLVPAGGRIRFAGHEIVGRPPHEIVRAGIVQVPEGREILARMSV